MSESNIGATRLEASSGEATSGTRPVCSEVRRRILFVDDEQAILDGLRSVLRAQRREWDVTFALGGNAALGELERSPFDVVVTDMRMPVVDGAELLRRTKEQQPRAVRIVLSGQTDAETAMKTVFTAHQFLAKPCDVDKLRGVVRRACNLNELVFSEELRALAGDVSLLPAPPRTYLAITRALSDAACNLSDVARIVEREPALCAKVLQIVNSAFFGLSRSVSSIAQATTYLGTLTLRNLALAMEAMATSKHHAGGLSPAQLEAFQVNALFVGMLARHWYAGDRRRADDAFVAGMLRNTGQLLLAAQGRSATQDEQAGLGAYLVGLWGIPHGVLEPIAFHRHPERAEHEGLEVVDVVHIADHVASELAPSPFSSSTPPPLNLARLERLGVQPSALSSLRSDAGRLLSQTKELLQ